MPPLLADVMVIPPARDWTIFIGNWQFGVKDFTIRHRAVSVLWYGPDCIQLNYSAPTIVAVAAASLLVFTFVAAYVVTRFRTRPVQGG